MTVTAAITITGIAIVPLVLLHVVNADPWHSPAIEFPTFRSFRRDSNPSFDADKLGLPMPDLVPLTVMFKDPSLRKYPNPSVPAAAVQPIREDPGRSWRWRRQASEPEPESEKDFTSFRDFFFFPELTILSPSPSSFGSSQGRTSGARKARQLGIDLDLDHDLPGRQQLAPHEVQLNQLAAQGGVVDPDDPFGNVQSYHPLPLSDPAFALPLIREDPHFRPDYTSVRFRRPTRNVDEAVEQDFVLAQDDETLVSLATPAEMASASEALHSASLGLESLDGSFDEDKVSAAIKRSRSLENCESA